MAQKRKRYDEQFEIAAARVALGGKTRAVDLARKLGIEDSTLLVPPALVGEGHGIARASGRSLGGKGCVAGARRREGRSARRARLLVALAAPTRLLSFARLLANSALLPSDETSSPPVFPKGYNGGRHKTAPERGAL